MVWQCLHTDERTVLETCKILYPLGSYLYRKRHRDILLGAMLKNQAGGYLSVRLWSIYLGLVFYKIDQSPLTATPGTTSLGLMRIWK
jgi:hypothetical protein